ncbi:MAG: TonB-dependent receptor [Woeseiaceae bacterium]|nr:TonB-dependent receptor [Woeseiaceae bacterium]
MQVISGQVSREIGSIDPATILQDSSAAGGQQVDMTFTGFVLDNGPGSSTIDLRGLGAQRTLVLINGRRAAPVGVEGAPFALDLNLIPSSLVDRYEILTDGASSVYGSDAIAGVANVILRKDFDGFEFEAYSTIPEYSNGIQNTISAAWGFNGDRSSFGIAADYTTQESVPRTDRPWSSGCESYREIDENGKIRTEFLGYNYDFGMKTSPCTIAFGARRIFDSGLFGSVYYTPGESNSGIPNFSEAADFVVSDLDDDGVPDVDFTDYWVTNETGQSHLFPEQDRVSVTAIAEHTFEGDMNITPYFEAVYSRGEVYAFDPGATLGVEVPATNPYNVCNPEGFGVDCGLAFDGYSSDPGYTDDFQAAFGGFCASIGLAIEDCVYNTFFAPFGAIGPSPVDAQVGIKGDRNFFSTELSQFRLVGGVRGDLPQISFGSIDKWSFDAAVAFSDSSGKSLRRGINEEALRYSLDTSRFLIPGDTSSPIICGDNDGCVPVNLFAPELYAGLLENDFATPAERDYVFSDRTFRTDYKQVLFSGIVTGDLYELPGGSLSAAVGYEFRNDEIDSIPNNVARDGLLYGYFRDLGAVGEKDTKEWFVEFEAPLIANAPAFRELTLNLSTRHTDDEFYGGAYTYSAKLAWRPVDSLLIKGTVGTSYRAPNLRENFLQGTSGFLSLNDPCVTPETAVTLGADGVVYDPDNDSRSQIVIDNCFKEGVDPTNLGIGVAGATTERYSMEILQGVGQSDLVEERSDSFTAGFAWEQPFTSAFDLTIGATYYEVDLIDEIIELDASTSISQCYNDPEMDSPYCANIKRDVTGNNLIDEIDQAFLNRDELKTRGVDLNIAVDWPARVFGRAVDLSADLNFNRKLQFEEVFVPVDGSNPSIDSDLGEFGLPEWEGQGVFRADVGDYRLTWSTRYLGSVRADQDLLDAYPFSNWLNGEEMYTCLGPDEGDVNCRPVGWAGNYFRHDMSVYYLGDVWTIGVGSRNVLNEAPPLVDSRVVFSGFNVPYGVGYDVNGRTYFVNVAARIE